MKTKLILLFLLLLAIKENKAQVSFTADITNGCLPLTVNFTNTSTLPAGTFYQWNFGNGPWQSSFNATYTYTWQNNYNVILEAYDTTGGGMNFLGSYNLPGGINANGSQLYYTADTVCPGESVEMYLYPYGNNTSWDFGDGNNSNQNQPSHSWITPGIYTVTVNSNTSCGNQTVTHAFVVMNNAQPNASFNSDGSICPNDPMQFWPQNYQAQSYFWDFGDGNTSTQSQPTHGWTTAGNYTVTLTLTSQCGTTDTHTETVNVQNNIQFENWVQIFTSTTTACPGDMINFDYNMNEMSTIIWDFDNGDISNEKEIQYSFSSPGTYNVSLYLQNGCNNDTILYTTINITTNLPFGGNPQMEINPNPICAGDEATFYCTNANSYLWNFGDTFTSTDNQPTHAYSSNGNYVVSIILTNGCGSDTTLIDTAYVNNSVVPQLDANNWGMPNADICPGDTNVFFAVGGTSYLWDFGDGNSTTQTSPITIVDGNNSFTVDIANHAYATAGTYTVTLTIFNSCGNSATDSITISVGGNQPADPEFIITSNNFNACAPIDFYTFGGSNYVWDFGDGNSDTTNSGNISHAYSTAGNYTASLTTTNGCGNTGTITQNITIDGMTNTTATTTTDASCFNSADGGVVVEISGGTLPYNFSIDGGASQSNNNFTSLLPENHMVEITDANGCILNLPIVINSPTAIDITIATVNSSCGNNDGSATANVTGGIGTYTYSWSTGGTAGVENNLSAGTYTLSVTDINSCIMTETFSVNDNGGPVVTFNTTFADMCSNENAITLTGGSPAGGIYSGQGVNSGIFDPSLAGAGTHTIIYSLTQSGCTSAVTQTITVFQAPSVNFTTTLDAVCMDAVPFNLTGGIPSGGNYSGNGVTANIFDPSIAGDGTHDIIYSVTNVNGCIGSDTNSIEVIEVIFNNSFNPMCIDANPLVLSGGSPAGGSYSGNGVNTGSFDPFTAGTGTHLITYTFSSGNCTMSDSQNIVVNDLPVVNFDTIIPMICIYDGSITLSGGSPAGGTYSGNGVSGNSFSPNTAGIGTHEIVYSFIDGNSCENSDTISISVDACLGIGNPSVNLSITTFPNPFMDFTVLTISKIKPEMIIVISDLTGKIIRSISILENQTMIQKGNLSTGIYLYSLTERGIVVGSGKLIIE